MDKSEYVQLAPVYYALAIAAVLNQQGGPCTEWRIRNEYPETDDHTSEQGSLIDRYLIWERAVGWLSARKMIKIKTDPFGPPIFSQSESFQEAMYALRQDESLPFSNFTASGDNAAWLLSALHSIENHYVNLDIQPSDFENVDSEWTPLPIDQSDPTTKNAIKALEQVVEEVRSDNGYNANLPQERDFVLEGLTGALGKLKSPSISAGYVKLALERLSIVGRRFAGSVREAAIIGARTAVIEFAKRHFGDALNYLWKFITFS